MRLIDADVALAAVKPYEPNDEMWSVTGGTAIRLICRAIDNTPTVDAVPVVRCKDCEYMCRDNVGVFCKIWNGYNGCGYDGFCNYGERKEVVDDGQSKTV